MEWLPTLRLDAVKLAWPAASRVTVAAVTLSTRKVTLPCGTPAPPPAALTAAVKLTGWLIADGLCDDVSVTVVPTRDTVIPALVPVIEPTAVSVAVIV